MLRLFFAKSLNVIIMKIENREQLLENFESPTQSSRKEASPQGGVEKEKP